MTNVGIFDLEYLAELAKALRDAHRMGAEKDEPEGVRYIQITDTLANQIATKLEIMVEHG